MNDAKTVLVTGATGQQGGALARLLLERGQRVRALTRKPDSPAARALTGPGAELAAGDFDDRASLERAMRGIDAVFVMATPSEAGVEAESRQAITVADAAKTAGVRHLVYSSVANADRQTGVPHFDSKYRVERHIQAIGIPSTIIGPVFFMDGLAGPWTLPGLREGKLALPLPAARRLQQVAVADIAAFAALVLERREPFLGQRIDLASDERSVEYVELPLEAMRAASGDSFRMFDWFDRVGFSVGASSQPDARGLRAWPVRARHRNPPDAGARAAAVPEDQAVRSGRQRVVVLARPERRASRLRGILEVGLGMKGTISP